jgi:hypothetical protein
MPLLLKLRGLNKGAILRAKIRNGFAPASRRTVFLEFEGLSITNWMSPFRLAPICGRQMTIIYGSLTLIRAIGLRIWVSNARGNIRVFFAASLTDGDRERLWSPAEVSGAQKRCCDSESTRSVVY